MKLKSSSLFVLCLLLIPAVKLIPLNAQEDPLSSPYLYDYADCDPNSDFSCCSEDGIKRRYIPTAYPHRVYIGPEIYHVHRKRDGGTRQNGWVYGVRAGYDRIKRFRLYWGGDVFWGQGPLQGKSGSKGRIKSTFTDESIEGRFGYTLQSKYGCHFSFTPFIGYGFFRETNHFRNHYPMKIKFQNRFDYVALGFYSSVEIYPLWTVGINFKAKVPYETHCRIKGDPEFDDSKQLIKEKTHYRIELPVVYRLCRFNERVELDFIPFYEFRHYGGHENFPFDFLDTKLNIYGINIQFSYRL